MSSYVDDTTCFLTSDSSFAALDVTLHLCQSASGSLLNRTKTHGLWPGHWRARKDRPLDTSWSSKDIKILGLVYTPTYSDMITYNWKAILDKFRAALSVWKRRDLYIHGRAKVISVFALSKVYYTARILTMPVHYARQFEREICSFIWDDRQPLVKRSVCIGPVAQGDSTSLIFLTVDTESLYGPDTQQMVTFARHWLRPIGIYRLGLAIFASANWQPPAQLYSNMPTFYRNLFQIWRKHGGNRIPRRPRTKEVSIGEPLWENNMIVDRHHHPLYYPSLARSGFITVGDLNTVSSTIYYFVKSAIPAHWCDLPHAQEVRTPCWTEQLALFANSRPFAFIRF